MPEIKPKLLLHVCCAPCATVPLERLAEEYDITGHFSNPNIHPYQEYRDRREETRRYFNQLGFELIVPSKYEIEDWFKATVGLEKEKEGGARCPVCYKLRLGQTAKLAKDLSFDHFTTTLTVSPHKKTDIINRIGQELAKEYAINYLNFDFKKEDGFKRSIELSKENKLIRQDYCGCVFSNPIKDKETVKIAKEFIDPGFAF